MKVARKNKDGSRIALSAVLIAASIILASCSTITPPPPAADKPSAVDTPSATPSATAGFYYEDAVGGFAITFPGEPSVEPRSGSDETRAFYSTEEDPTQPDAIVYMAGGTTASPRPISPESLQDVLFFMATQWVDLKIPEETFEFNGMPALTADFTDQTGKAATILVAGEGDRYYQLVVFGGTPEERQTFFNSFELLN